MLLQKLARGGDADVDKRDIFFGQIGEKLHAIFLRDVREWIRHRRCGDGAIRQRRSDLGHAADLYDRYIGDRPQMVPLQ
jgi:hypothetical protein